MTTAVECPLTGKRGYPGPHSARKAAYRLGFKVRAYFCRACGRFHATHEPRRRG